MLLLKETKQVYPKKLLHTKYVKAKKMNIKSPKNKLILLTNILNIQYNLVKNNKDFQTKISY
jgi:hypothetical protein